MTDFLTTWFANPALLLFLGALPALAVLNLVARQRRQKHLAVLGQPAAIQKLRPAPLRMGRARAVLQCAALALLILGAAGPRWGRVAAAHGLERALVLVLDVSRSMLAEQPSRQELARRALRDLGETLTEHGGPRVALVVFAAHAQVAFPLTGDYDHMLDALGRIDAEDLPPALRPREDEGAVSGTRIGEALRLALALLDVESSGDILLLSDGDDPGGDEEWLQGAEEARRRHVPVHTVGVGNPRLASTIPFGLGVLEYAGETVKTRLEEKPLQEIARRTGGSYVPAHGRSLGLGKLLPSILSARSEPAAAEALTLPVPQPRYAWFLGPALLLLALTLLVGERRTPAGPALPRFLALPLLIGLVSAAPLPEVEALLRKGNQAFERGDDEAALQFFTRAEDVAADPGLVAFNKAASLYRLGRFAEAALHYQRCLEDGVIPPRRRALANFQMGNACLKDSQGTDRSMLERGLDAYRACLLMDETPDEVRTDARHNLEIARMLWLKTLPDPSHPPKNGDKPGSTRPKVSEDGGHEPKNGQGDSEAHADGKKSPSSPGKDGANTKSKKAATGPLTVLEDRNELVPLGPQETEAHLAAIAQRILQERRQYRRHAVTPPDNVKDW